METNFREWILKAENDWRAVKILFESKNPPHDVLVFHCQQLAEKYLKAFLVKNFFSVKKTHDLLNLLTEAEKFEPALNMLRKDFNELNDYSIVPRYPDEFREYSEAEVDKAIASSKRIRHFFRKELKMIEK